MFKYWCICCCVCSSMVWWFMYMHKMYVNTHKYSYSQIYAIVKCKVQKIYTYKHLRVEFYINGNLLNSYIQFCIIGCCHCCFLGWMATLNQLYRQGHEYYKPSAILVWCILHTAHYIACHKNVIGMLHF